MAQITSDHPSVQVELLRTRRRGDNGRRRIGSVKDGWELQLKACDCFDTAAAQRWMRRMRADAVSQCQCARISGHWRIAQTRAAAGCVKTI